MWQGAVRSNSRSYCDESQHRPEISRGGAGLVIGSDFGGWYRAWMGVGQLARWRNGLPRSGSNHTAQPRIGS